MSEKFEQNIRDWFNKSKTVNLEYLDLAEVAKPQNSDIANNLGVIYNRVSLLSKVSLKHFYLLREENQDLRQEVVVLRKVVTNLERVVIEQKPFSTTELRILIRDIIKQPKLVEEEALKITEELKKSVYKVEHLIAELKVLIGG